MDSLPTELLLIICENLETKDVPSFRLLNRRCAAAGQAYLFPDGQIDFYLCKRHLENLKGIANHPEFCQLVSKLQYESHLLTPRTMSFKKYKENVKENIQFRDDLKEEWKRSGASDGLPFSLNYDYFQMPESLEGWQSHYNIYVGMSDTQKKLLSTKQDYSAFVQLFRNCPNLRDITYSSGYIFHNHSRIHHPFEEAMQRPEAHMMPQGVKQLKTLLSAAGKAGARLDSLRAGVVGWQFFKATLRIHSHVWKTLLPLTYLQMEITTGFDEEDEDLLGVEVPECREFLNMYNALASFLERLENLETLHFRFDSAFLAPDDSPVQSCHPAHLVNIVSADHFWPNLRVLHLGCFEACENEVLALLVRHKDTLRDVGLQDVCLLNRCLRLPNFPLVSSDWRRLLRDMREKLSLEFGCLYGDIWSVGTSSSEYEQWHLALDDEYFESHPKAELCHEINKYLTGKIDECPLSEENMGFQ